MTDNNNNYNNNTATTNITQSVARCGNCSALVNGFSFCPQCGQKTDTHVLTFREMLEEFVDGLFNMDSRIWRSLLPLALQPGRLTLEYLRGRRMHYLPPFRLYLILSVIFFLIPGNNGNAGDNFDRNSGTEPEIISLEDLPVTGTANEGVNDGANNGDNRGGFANQVRNEFTSEIEAARNADRGVFRNSAELCSLDGLPRSSLFTIVLRDACLKFFNDPQRLTQNVIDMVPVMMIVGIPLVALFMFVVYALSGRYYLEHIIFLLHTHAFFFLVSIVIALSSALGQRYDFLFGIMDWFRMIAGWYIPIYIFLAMLKVYGDGKVLTILKGCFVLFGYLTSIVIVSGFGILYTAANA